MLHDAIETLLRNGWISKKQFHQLVSMSAQFHSVQELLLHIEKSELIETSDRDEVNLLLRRSFQGTDFHLIRGSLNPRMDAIYQTAKKVSQVDTTVLILGESGVGKSRLAKLIHEHSNRKDRPFVTISCGSIPETLLESELFGVEKGAYTGAVKSRQGRFQLADTGTIFLDEIADLPLPLQVKLLRVIQEKTIEPLGSAGEIKVNVRIIAATNRDIDDDVKTGRFREDLYFRLNVVPLTLLSLRERKEDIENLTNYFLEQCKVKYKKPFQINDSILWNVLNEYSWPGNVRELENTIERLCVLADQNTLRYEDLPERILKQFQKMIAYQESSIPLSERRIKQKIASYPTMAELEKDHIIRTLTFTSGKLTEAADLLGIHRNTLRQKIERYNIDMGTFTE